MGCLQRWFSGHKKMSAYGIGPTVWPVVDPDLVGQRSHGRCFSSLMSGGGGLSSTLCFLVVDGAA